MMLVLEEHTIIDRKIGYSFFLEYLSLIGKDKCLVNTIFRGIKELREGTVLRIVLSGLYF